MATNNGPLTWNNITDSRPRDPYNSGAGSNSGAAMFLAGLNNLGGVFDNQRAQNTQVETLQRAALNNEYMNTLQGADSPEALAEMERTGVLERMRAGMDVKGQDAVRGAYDARTTGLRTQQTENRDYAAKEQTIAEQPLVQAFNEQLARRDPESAQKILDYTNISNKTPLIAQLTKSQLDWATADHNAKVLPFERERALNEAISRVAAQSDADVNANNAREDKAGQEEVIAEDLLYRATKTKDRVTFTEMMKNLGISLPVDAEGNINMQSLTKAQRVGVASFVDSTYASEKSGGIPIVAGVDNTDNPAKTALKNLNDKNTTSANTLRSLGIGNGTEALATVFTGDTKKIADYKKALTDSGKYSPRALAKLFSQIESSFDSTSIGMTRGVEANNKKIADEKNEIVNKENSRNNLFLPGSPDAFASREEILKNIPNMMNNSGVNKEDDIPAIKESLFKMSVTGVAMKDGVKRMPPQALIEAAINAAEGDWISPYRRAYTMREYINKHMLSQDMLDQVERSQNAENFVNRKQLTDVARASQENSKK